MLGILGYFLQVAAGHILYLALHLESGSFPRPLPPERECAAFADLRRGGSAAAAARDTLIRHNLRLVAHICKKYYAGDAAQDDYISIGTIGLIKAVDTFDPDKGKKFASYASRCILGEKWLREKLRKSLSVLSEPERVVIKLLYKDELTPEQAARKLGVTSSTIRSHKKNALDKLKKEMLEDD